jgi:hypothetical protein
MQQRVQGGHVVRAYFAQNVHGDIAQGRIVTAQKREQAVDGLGTADFPQGILARFLYADIRAGDAPAQELDALGKHVISSLKGRSPEDIRIVALQIMKNLLGVPVRCAIGIHMQLGCLLFALSGGMPPRVFAAFSRSEPGRLYDHGCRRYFP